jgi:hypothetical protein
VATFSSNAVMPRRASPNTRKAGWLLVAAFTAIIIAMVVAVVGLFNGPEPTISTIAELQQYLSPLAAPWIIVWISSTLQYVFVAAGTWFLLPALEKRYASITGFIGMGCALLSAIFRVWECYLNIGVLANAPFTTDSPPNAMGTWIGWVGLQGTADLLLTAAVLCVALALALSRQRTRISSVIAIFSALALVASLFMFISSGFTNQLPPFVPTLLALPLGISLLAWRERV